MSRTPRRKGLTALELMVVIGIISVVLGLTLSVLGHATRLGRQTGCLSNMRELALALNAYHTQYRQLPADDRPERLEAALFPLIQQRDVFHCPDDPRPGASSYAPYYVRRRDLDPRDFILGCPRHSGGEVATVLFGSAGAKGGRLGAMTHDGQPVKVGQRVTGGLLRFADGSVASIETDLSVDIITSFQRPDGSHYTILRVPVGESGAVALDVNPKSRFEVVTPAAIAGSEGTTFYVVVHKTGTERKVADVVLYVRKGKVNTRSRGFRAHSRLVEPGEAVLVASPSGDIVDCNPPNWNTLPRLPSDTTQGPNPR